MNSCYNCEDRYVGCHSECEKYKNFREELDKKNKERHSRKARVRKEREYIYKALKRMKNT